MRLISADQIRSLGISPAICVDWVRECFSIKYRAQLPPKISLHPQGNDFFNTMPCILPNEYSRFGVKVVHRIKGAIPSLGSEILLYDSSSGDLLAMLDGDWITTMRTGAVATLAIQTLKKSGDLYYSFIGLGNTARATLLCLLESEPNNHFNVILKAYKNQSDLFIERFKDYRNVSFYVEENIKEIVKKSDVIISCITEADGLLCDDDSLFREGCLIVPIHTRGFQNCDLFFDKVFADDTAHVSGFKYFNQFKCYSEISEVLNGQKEGRINDNERILSYNIGLGLHDVLFADKIYKLMMESQAYVEWRKETDKFWI